MAKKTESDNLKRVAWVIDVPGDTPEQAAFNALKIMRDKDNIGLTFEVRMPSTNRKATVDLEDCAVCDDCGQVFQVAEDNDFAVIPNLNERIAPGGMVPACECPKCGSLAYPASRMTGQGSASEILRDHSNDLWDALSVILEEPGCDIPEALRQRAINVINKIQRTERTRVR